MNAAERVTVWAARQIAKRAPYSPSNRFLEGPFAPVADEHTAFDLPVTGRIPEELDGLYVRNGPNPVGVANPGQYHWFVGDGMVHGVRLRGGRAEWYRNRFVASDAVNVARGREPLPGNRHGIVGAVNTNVIGHAGKLWAIVEAGGVPVELDPELESVAHRLFESGAVHPFSAHPHRDPATGDLHVICYDPTLQNRVTYLRLDANGRIARTVDVAVPGSPMIHDCAVTASKVVILDLPVALSMSAFLGGSPFPYRWNAKRAARVGLLPKDGDGKSVRWYPVEPCYIFHTANAFDREDGSVVFDAVVHPTMFDDSHHGPDSKLTTFERWVVDPARGSVARTTIDDSLAEFPRYDERRATQPYRYAYTVGTGHEVKAEPLYRHDLANGTTSAAPVGPHHVPAETIFIPRSPEAAEDDGWLMTFVYDLREDRSTLVILNAADFTGEPAAVVHLPGRVPLGFHGNWIALSS